MITQTIKDNKKSEAVYLVKEFYSVFSSFGGQMLELAIFLQNVLRNDKSNLLSEEQRQKIKESITDLQELARLEVLFIETQAQADKNNEASIVLAIQNLCKKLHEKEFRDIQNRWLRCIGHYYDLIALPEKLVGRAFADRVSPIVQSTMRLDLLFQSIEKTINGQNALQEQVLETKKSLQRWAHEEVESVGDHKLESELGTWFFDWKSQLASPVLVTGIDIEPFKDKEVVEADAVQLNAMLAESVGGGIEESKFHAILTAHPQIKKQIEEHPTSVRRYKTERITRTDYVSLCAHAEKINQMIKRHRSTEQIHRYLLSLKLNVTLDEVAEMKQCFFRRYVDPIFLPFLPNVIRRRGIFEHTLPKLDAINVALDRVRSDCSEENIQDLLKVFRKSFDLNEEQEQKLRDVLLHERKLRAVLYPVRETYQFACEFSRHMRAYAEALEKISADSSSLVDAKEKELISHLLPNIKKLIVLGDLFNHSIDIGHVSSGSVTEEIKQICTRINSSEFKGLLINLQQGVQYISSLIPLLGRHSAELQHEIREKYFAQTASWGNLNIKVVNFLARIQLLLETIKKEIGKNTPEANELLQLVQNTRDLVAEECKKINEIERDRSKLQSAASSITARRASLPPPPTREPPPPPTMVKKTVPISVAQSQVSQVMRKSFPPPPPSAGLRRAPGVLHNATTTMRQVVRHWLGTAEESVSHTNTSVSQSDIQVSAASTAHMLEEMRHENPASSEKAVSSFAAPSTAKSDVHALTWGVASVFTAITVTAATGGTALLAGGLGTAATVLAHKFSNRGTSDSGSIASAISEPDELPPTFRMR